MKKYESILKRVEIYENKCCSEYQKIGGSLFKVLRTLLLLSTAYLTFINVLSYITIAMHAQEGDTNVYMEKDQMVWLCIVTVALVAAVVLLYTPYKFTGCIIGYFAPFGSVWLFVELLADKLNGFLGYKPAFYYRHAIPAFIIFMLIIWIMVLWIRERIITNSRYKKIEANIYENYRNQFINKEDFAITDEMWDEYIKNYDPTAFKNLK